MRPFTFVKSDGEVVKKDREALDLLVQAAGDRARKCLDQEDFKKYRDDYRRAQDKLVAHLIEYNKNFHKNGSEGIQSYAMNISNLLTKLEVIRSLLNVVAADSKKGQKHERHEDQA